MNISNLTYSELVYLLADRLIQLRARLANLENHPSGQKIPIKPLAEMMTIGAFAYLADENFVKFTVENVKKLFIIPSKEVKVEILPKDADNLSGLEKKLYENISKYQTLQKSVYYLLDADDSVPWFDVMYISKNSLEEKGYISFTEEKRFIGKTKIYHFREEKSDEWKNKYEFIKSKIDGFFSTPGYEAVKKSISKGISQRVEQGDMDMGD